MRRGLARGIELENFLCFCLSTFSLLCFCCLDILNLCKQASAVGNGLFFFSRMSRLVWQILIGLGRAIGVVGFCEFHGRKEN